MVSPQPARSSEAVEATQQKEWAVGREVTVGSCGLFARRLPFGVLELWMHDILSISSLPASDPVVPLILISI